MNLYNKLKDKRLIAKEECNFDTGTAVTLLFPIDEYKLMCKGLKNGKMKRDVVVIDEVIIKELR